MWAAVQPTPGDGFHLFTLQPAPDWLQQFERAAAEQDECPAGGGAR